MKFYDALRELDLRGRSIARCSWTEYMYVSRMSAGDQIGSISVPFLFACNEAGDWVPWQPNQGDIFADDWQAMTAPMGQTHRKEGYA